MNEIENEEIIDMDEESKSDENLEESEIEESDDDSDDELTSI